MKVDTPVVSVELNKDDLSALEKVSETEIAQLFSSQVAFWRWRNLARIAKKFEKICEKKGFDKHKVAPKLLVPFIEDASMEDDENIQDIWARILAQESNEPGSISVRTLEVLKGLSRKEALTFEKKVDDMFITSDGDCYCYYYGSERLNDYLDLSDAGILVFTTNIRMAPDLPFNEEHIIAKSIQGKTAITGEACSEDFQNAKMWQPTIPIAALTSAGRELFIALHKNSGKDSGSNFSKIADDLKKRNPQAAFRVKPIVKM